MRRLRLRALAAAFAALLTVAWVAALTVAVIADWLSVEWASALLSLPVLFGLAVVGLLLRRLERRARTQLGKDPRTRHGEELYRVFELAMADVAATRTALIVSAREHRVVLLQAATRVGIPLHDGARAGADHSIDTGDPIDQ